MDSSFTRKFKTAELHVFTSTSWTVSVRPIQITLGSLVLALNRSSANLGGLSNAEAMELSQLFRRIEQLLAVTFEPDKINYLALMMVDAHVHFHVIPRYSRPVRYGGHDFTDTAWPLPPKLDERPHCMADPYEVMSTFRLNLPKSE